MTFCLRKDTIKVSENIFLVDILRHREDINKINFSTWGGPVAIVDPGVKVVATNKLSLLPDIIKENLVMVTNSR